MKNIHIIIFKLYTIFTFFQLVVSITTIMGSYDGYLHLFG